jgi:hypothetical protein
MPRAVLVLWLVRTVRTVQEQNSFVVLKRLRSGRTSLSSCPCRWGEETEARGRSCTDRNANWNLQWSAADVASASFRVCLKQGQPHSSPIPAPAHCLFHVHYLFSLHLWNSGSERVYLKKKVYFSVVVIVRYCRMSWLSASASGGPVFESQPEDKLLWGRKTWREEREHVGELSVDRRVMI